MIRSVQPLRLGIPEAAGALRISRAYLYEKIRRGEIRATKDGARTFIALTELQRYVAATEKSAA